MEWYCFRTQNKKESFAAQNVKRVLGVEVFCPMISQIKQTQKGKQRYTEAIFPCYAFVRMDLSQHFMSFRSVHGVTKLLQVGNAIPIVSDVFISSLKDELNDSDTLWIEAPSCEMEEQVRIDSGPFSGLIGKLINAPQGGDRLCILLDMLGQQVPLHFDKESLQISQIKI